MKYRGERHQIKDLILALTQFEERLEKIESQNKFFLAELAELKNIFAMQKPQRAKPVTPKIQPVDLPLIEELELTPAMRLKQWGEKIFSKDRVQ